MKKNYKFCKKILENWFLYVLIIFYLCFSSGLLDTEDLFNFICIVIIEFLIVAYSGYEFIKPKLAVVKDKQERKECVFKGIAVVFIAVLIEIIACACITGEKYDNFDIIEFFDFINAVLLIISLVVFFIYDLPKNKEKMY